MARLSPCRSPRWNPPPTGKSELAGAACIEGSGTLTPIPLVSRTPTSAPATAITVTLCLDNKLFKQFIKAYLDAQMPNQTEVDLEPRK